MALAVSMGNGFYRLHTEKYATRNWWHRVFFPENSCNGFTTLEGKGSFGHAALGIKHKQWLSYKDIGHCKGNAQLLCVMY